MGTRLALISAVAVFGTALGQGQGQSQSESQAWTVKQVLSEAKDDQTVVVRGQVVRMLGDEDFILSDDTGEIRVDVDDDDPTARQLQPGATVEVHGEADVDSAQPTEIEAARIVPM